MSVAMSQSVAVDGANLLWSCGGKPAQSSDEVIDSRDLLDHDLGKVVAKINVAETLRKQLRKGPYGDKGILDLMCDASGQSAKRG